MRKLFALGLAACMLLGTCAPAAFAAEEPSAAVVEPATPESARTEGSGPVVSTFSATPAVRGVAPRSEPALSFRVTTEAGVTFTSDDPFAAMTMVEGKSYTLQVLLDGDPLDSTHAYSLAGAAIPKTDMDTPCLEVTDVDTQNGTVTITPIAVTSTPIFLGTLRLDIRDNDASTTTSRFFTCTGSVVSDNDSDQFVNAATGAPVSTVKAGPNSKELTLQLNGVDESSMSIEYSTTVPASVTWSTDGQPFGTVKVTVGQALGSNCFFVARVTDKTTGELVKTAVLELEWYDDTVGPSDALENGYRLYFGSKSGDDYYAFSTSSYTQLAPDTADPYFTTTLNVFFGIEESGNLYPTYTAMPEGCNYDIQVNSPDGALEILSTTPPSGTEPFAVTFKFRGDSCTSATLQATVTSGDQDYTASYVINVVESAQAQEVTVQSATELQQALANPALVPNSVITLKSGTYEGNFIVKTPVTLVADGLDGTQLPYDKETGALDTTTTGVTIQGSLEATCEGVSAKGLRFINNTNTETALKNPADVQNCTFAGYQTAIVLDDGLRASTNHILYNNGFEDCDTAISFVNREWRSQIQNNSFLNCDVAIALGENCQVDGIQSNVYNTTINGGKWTNNLFRGEAGDLVLKDDRNGSGAMATATLLLTYNYYDENTRRDSAFAGSYCIHDVFYTSPDMTAVTTSKPLDAVAQAGGLNLVAQTSGRQAPDSALNVTGDLFTELGKSTTDELQLKVWDLLDGQETLAATWNFAREDLTTSLARDVNLGVDAELNVNEQAIVDQALTSGTTYQPISFDHSGELPGTATVDVPLTEAFADTDDLMLYYINENTDELEEVGPVTVKDGNLEFSIEHCSSYVVKSSSSASAGNTGSTTTNKDTGSQAAAGSTAPAATAAPKPDTTVYYTCQACGYHNWTATGQGYRCDNCGYLETVKQLSGYGNVKGVYEPGTAAQTAAATTAIPQTGETGEPMAWVVLLAASVLGLSGALVRKHRRNR